MSKRKLLTYLPLLGVLLYFSNSAYASPSCPNTLPTYALGADAGGASWVQDIVLQSDHYNKAQNIVLCRYQGAQYTVQLGYPSKYKGTYKIDKFYKDGDWKENPKLGWNIRLYLKIDDDWQFVCSGAALNPDWVLTAEHCMEPGYENAKHWKVYANKTDKSDPYNEKVSVSSFKYFPDKHAIGGDLMLIKLKSPLVLRAYAKLNETNIDDGTDVQFYGWGCSDACTDTGDNQYINEGVHRVYTDSGWSGLSAPEEYDGYVRVERRKGKNTVSGDSGGAYTYNNSVIAVHKGSWADQKFAVDVSRGDARKWIQKTIR